jgi:ATP-dependent RNA helicase SUPV3L1/SUV3
VPLDRKTEQKLWDTFKATIDSAFAKKDEARNAARAAHIASLSVHDKAVLEASKALDEANTSGEAAKIQAAMTALQAALRGQAAQVAAAPKADEAIAPRAEESTAPAAAEAPAPVKVAKPLVAMRSDDRKSAKAPEPSKFGKRPDDRGAAGQAGRGFGGRDARESRPDRGPRLSDEAFHAQRKAMEQAEFALKKLQMQAHGEVVTSILSAWQNRAADAIPAANALGKAVNSATRTQWTQALNTESGKPEAAADAAGTALLRLEMATGVPTPADYLNDRRALQLQLLTKRNDPAPSQTWGADVAKVLESGYSEVAAKRLQANLKALLK